MGWLDWSARMQSNYKQSLHDCNKGRLTWPLTMITELKPLNKTYPTTMYMKIDMAIAHMDNASMIKTYLFTLSQIDLYILSLFCSQSQSCKYFNATLDCSGWLQRYFCDSLDTAFLFLSKAMWCYLTHMRWVRVMVTHRNKAMQSNEKFGAGETHSSVDAVVCCVFSILNDIFHVIWCIIGYVILYII